MVFPRGSLVVVSIGGPVILTSRDRHHPRFRRKSPCQAAGRREKGEKSGHRAPRATAEQGPWGL
jgi:hypothetical protein